MTKVLPPFLILLLVGFLLVPLTADALPKGDVGYKVYHQEGSKWIRYMQSDAFPPGGATPPTNVWKYEYEVTNYLFTNGVYEFMIFFNSDNLLWATYTSALGPTTWAVAYSPPIAPNKNWKVRFRTPTTSGYMVMPNNTLPGYSVQFTWVRPDTLPGTQNTDLKSSTGSEADVTHELPPEQTPVAEDTWGRIKSLFLR
jgi:hypothetical protein